MTKWNLNLLARIVGFGMATVGLYLMFGAVVLVVAGALLIAATIDLPQKADELEENNAQRGTT